MLHPLLDGTFFESRSVELPRLKRRTQKLFPEKAGTYIGQEIKVGPTPTTTLQPIVQSWKM